MIIPHRVLSLAPLAPLLTAVAAADVLDVRGPAPDYDQIQAAVQAAADGDVIRVWPGSYEIFQVNGKALSIAAVIGGSVQISGAYRVMNLGADQSVSIYGLQSTGNESEGALVVGCDGAVRFQDSQFVGQYGLQGSIPEPPGYGNGWAAVRVLDSSDVSFAGCTLQAGSGASIGCEDTDYYVGDGASALSAVDSTVALFESNLSGGHGGGSYDTTDTYGGAGGHGMYTLDSTVYIAGTLLAGGAGGNGGDGDFPFYYGGDGGPGGDAIHAVASVVRTLDELLTPGSGGFGGGMGGPGHPGQSVRLIGGATWDALTGDARHLTAPALVTEADPLAFTVRGEVGDLVFAMAATDARQLFDARLHGPLMVGTSFALPRFVVGTIDASGSVVYAKHAPYQMPFETTTWHVQAYARSTGGELFLTGPAVVTVLDSSF